MPFDANIMLYTPTRRQCTRANTETHPLPLTPCRNTKMGVLKCQVRSGASHTASALCALPTLQLIEREATTYIAMPCSTLALAAAGTPQSNRGDGGEAHR